MEDSTFLARICEDANLGQPRPGRVGHTRLAETLAKRIPRNRSNTAPRQRKNARSRRGLDMKT